MKELETQTGTMSFYRSERTLDDRVKLHLAVVCSRTEGRVACPCQFLATTTRWMGIGSFDDSTLRQEMELAMYRAARPYFLGLQSVVGSK